MRIIPQAGGDLRAKGAAGKELADRLRETRPADTSSMQKGTAQPGDVLSRYLARTEAVLQGFRALNQALIAKESIDVDVLVAGARFDGEEVLRAHAEDLRQIASRNDQARLARLIANTENNARALLGGRDISAKAESLTVTSEEVDAMMKTVVSQLVSGESPNVNLSANKVADLLK